jgi:hypothetical protein
VESYKELIKIAKESVEEVDEPYKSIAFREILRSLLLKEPIPPQPASLIAKRIEGKTLQELYNERKPKGHPNLVLLIAYHFNSIGESVFNVKDVEESYSKLLIRKPKNLSDMINVNRKKGYIMVSDEKKDGLTGFTITHQGIEFVENNFSR